MVIVVAASFVVLQFYRPDRNNPPVIEAETLEAATIVPEDVHAVLSGSCADCHSHKTIYPWYSNISPFSWFLADHIDDGRSHLNFSTWNTYSVSQKTKRLEEICEQVEARAMPLPSYLWIHRNSRLNESDSKVLCDWAEREKSRIEILGLS